MGTLIDRARNINVQVLKYHNISVQSGLKLAFSSYLRACTVALDAAHTPGDQYQQCIHSAQTYMENNVYSILRQRP